MARLERASAVLQVSTLSMRRMRDFFVEKLGFVVGTVAGDPPSFVTLDRDGQTIMLACTRNFNFRQKGWAAYFWTDDIDTLFKEVLSRGGKIKGEVIDKPYGCREFVAIAPDGREIVFGQLIGQ